MVVNDVWGQIVIEPKYEKIINSREFSDLKNKTQLGLNCNLNATHTRYQHSIGTYYLACKLINICKSKFSRVLNITPEDEKAIKCMALTHDIGHGCFSHVSEQFLDGTHENRTQAILMDSNSDVHKIIVSNFGINVLNKVVDLIQMKEKIKDKSKVYNENDLILIIGKLISGGIDIDRIDYIFRDSKQVNGEECNYSSILDSIELECIDDSLEVVFNGETEYTIANFFNKRFELYDRLYFDNQTRILESIFGKFIKKINKKLDWETTEIEMNNIFRENLDSADETIKRYASLLSTRKLDSDILIKEINEKTAYDFFKNKLFANVAELINYSDCFLETTSSIKIYNKDNKVFINKDGLIQDIMESSKILNSELEKEKYVLAVDLNLLAKLLNRDNIDSKEIISKIKKAFKIEIEQEKKYIFSEHLKTSSAGSQIVKKELNLRNPKYTENHDIYYDENDMLENHRIALRKRITKDKIEYTLKRPLNDSTSISKREEKNFNSLEEAILFIQNEWKIPVSDLKERVSLHTLRTKYDFKYHDCVFEIVFDRTQQIVEGNELGTNCMIECELKEGNSTGLYFIDKIMKRFDFLEECKYSKKEIAMNTMKKENIEVKENYVKQMNSFIKH